MAHPCWSVGIDPRRHTIDLSIPMALRMSDRGEIAVGKLADLAIVRMDESGIPQVEATFLEGRPSLTFARYPALAGEVKEAVFSMNGAQSTM